MFKLIKIIIGSLVLLLAVGLLQAIPVEANYQQANASDDPWLQKPVLPYLMLTKGDRFDKEVQYLFTTLDLSQNEEKALKQIAFNEQEQMLNLYRATQKIVTDKSLSSSEQSKAIGDSRYNEQIAEIMDNTDQEVHKLLGDRYSIFRNWIIEWWGREIKTVANLKQPSNKPGIQTAANSCYMFATQYFGYTDYEISLPDQYVKFANLGWPIPSPYNSWYISPPYTVNLNIGSYWVYGVTVKDVGPWNIDDNYWDVATGTPPRRLFSDIPICWSEAEYAYYYGYNGGVDQYGRTVTVPTSVDLTPSVAADLGLDYLENSNLTVYYSDLP